MTTEIKDGDPIEAPVSLNEKREIQEAVKRSELWELAGFPTSQGYMPESEYIRQYQDRVFFIDAKVASQVQLIQKFVICPKCREDKPDGRVIATKMYITVEDDTMTVFPAVGHFNCHRCGFEEWHPLKTDPRIDDQEEQRQRLKQAGLSQIYGGTFNNNPYQNAQAPLNAASLRNQMATAAAQYGLHPSVIKSNRLMGEAFNKAMDDDLSNRIAKGITPGMGPIYGMTDEEKEALHRLYQKTQTAKAPQIIETPEEAAMLAQMQPIDKRQWIIQKLRDLKHL